jgi:murein L,D-transpeptidase YafK
VQLQFEMVGFPYRMTTTPANTADPIFQFKQMQKDSWKHFAPARGNHNIDRGAWCALPESSLERGSSMPAVAPE